MIKTTIQILGLLMLFASNACATRIVYEALDSVVRKAHAAVVVDVNSVSPTKTDRYSQRIEFDAAPIKMLFGKADFKGRHSYHYAQGLPHVRGKSAVSPLATGSGLEFEIKKGARVILLLDEDDRDAKTLKVLRIEPMGNVQRIMHYQRKVTE